MSILSVSKKLSSSNQIVISLDPEICLHSRDRFATCEACFDICPEKAIEPGKPPALNEANCKSCLACLPVCPVDAFQGKDAVSSTLKCAPRLQGKKVDILCERHPNPSLGLDKTHTGLKIRGCLAGLGVGALVEFALCGLNEVTLRLDACQDCIWGNFQKLILTQYKTAEELLNALNIKQNIQYVEVLDVEMERPFWQTESPPLSRRDLFKVTTNQGRVSLGKILDDGLDKNQKQIGRNNYRLSRIGDYVSEAASVNKSLPSGLPLASVTVWESCIACGACARICPTEALYFLENKKEKTFDLLFTAPFCVGCEACVHICPTDAIEVNHHPSVDEIFNANVPSSLVSGTLQVCEKCRAFFAGKPEEELCPICIARKQNPFGPRSDRCSGPQS